ncbi:MAG: MerR family transcriptional regulator [Clostridia bacterium]|nr:MerR family transcriptional regulator [Clostridia bacterium]
MNIRNCKQCGKIYAYTGSDLCPVCRKEEDDMFDKVREYIYSHPGANTLEVSEETGVEEKIILKFLREGRLELKTAGLGLDCERCGVSITTGRYCSKCAKDLKEGFSGGQSAGPAKKSANSRGMYTANSRKKRN